MASPACFVSVEGIDSVGKTTHLKRMQAELAAKSMRVTFVSDPPKHSPWDTLHETFQRGEKMSKLAGAVLLLSARIDNSQRVIVPTLTAGTPVIADRYADSWLAYQSVRLADEFGCEDAALEYLLNVQHEYVKADFIRLPDHTLYIADDPEVAMARSNNLGKTSIYEKLDVQIKVARTYDKLAQRFPERISRIDIAGRDEAEVYSDLRGRIYEQLGV